MKHPRLPLAVLFLAVLSGLVFTACQSPPREAGDWQAFTGKVVYVSKFRGFWGIEADGLGKLNPMQLPEEFQQVGLRVSGEVRLRPDVVSVKAWGTVAEFRELQAE